MIHSSPTTGLMTHLTTLTGRVSGHPSNVNLTANVSRFQNLPITGLQPYINEPPKTTALIDDASNVELGKKILTMSSNAQATYVMQPELQPRPNFSTT
jgi:hypothetical protein